MKNYFIVGGDGFARETYFNLKSHPDFNIKFSFGGFLGHAGYGHTVDYKNVQHLYKGELIDYKFAENDYCLIGAGFPELRKKIYHDLKAINAKVGNFISATTTMDLDSLEMGEGNIIIDSGLTVNIKIGNGNIFNGGVIVGHDSNIGNFNFFGPRSQVLGAVTIGDENTIGANAILLPNTKIGQNNKIAPLSTVYKGCKNNGYYLGNPAMKVGNI